jgi:ATP-dependent Clp protease protease subunit
MKRSFSKIHFGLNQKMPDVITKSLVKHKNIKLYDNENNSKKNKQNEEDDEDDENPFSKIGKEESEVYMNENHLYFQTGVTEESVDKVKKSMREYAVKVNKLKTTHIFSSAVIKPLYLHIYSPGGDVHAGFTLYDFITEYKKKIPVYTVIDGMAASAATIISISGSKRYITPSSYMLIHQLSTFMGGNFEQLKEEFTNCEKVMNKIIDLYAIHTKITKRKLPKILKHDFIWDANECLSYGLVDEIKLVDLFND